jgi:hypothetical protein
MSVWFKHTSNLMNPKFIRLRSLQGFEGVGIYFTLLEYLSTQEEGKLEKSLLTSVGFCFFGMENRLQKIVDLSLELGLLSSDDTHIWQEDVSTSVTSFSEQKEKNKQKVQAFRGRKKENECNGYKSVTQRLPSISNSYSESRSLDLNKNSQVQKPDQDFEPAEPETELEREAENILDQPNGTKTWEKSPQFVNVGRRPIKKYPKVFMHRSELARAMKAYEDANIKHRLGDAIASLSSKLDSWMLENKDSPMRAPPIYSWLTTFALKAQLENELMQKRLQNANEVKLRRVG